MCVCKNGLNVHVPVDLRVEATSSLGGSDSSAKAMFLRGEKEGRKTEWRDGGM